MSNLKPTKTEAKGASGTMKTIFELVQHDISLENNENGTIIPPSYPEFEVTKLSLGFYTSLAKSEAAMKRFIKATMKRAEEYKMGYCYYIHEYLCNSKWGLNTYSCRSYLPNGDLFDAILTPERDLDDEPAMFPGRTPEQTRFKEGDIVEILSFEHAVELGIVCGTPPTVDEVQKRLNKFSIDFFDFSDDCYLVLSLKKSEYEELNIESTQLSDANWIGQYHSHPLCTNVFPPHLPVPEKMREILLKMYHNY